MMDKVRLNRNIKLNNIIGGLMWGRFFIPVLALFYIASQVTLEQFTIIMAVFAFSTLILEIPTGVVADLLGKKKSLLISRFMYIIEIFLIAFFNGFWIFLIAKIISGIGVSFSSGTNQALLYDTLKKLGKEKEYKKIAGKANTISKISMAIVFTVGAYLFTLNYKLPAILSLPLTVLGFALTFFLVEPYPPNKKINFRDSISHLKEGLNYFKKNYYLKYFAFFTFLIGSTLSIILSLSSKYYEIIFIPIAFIGTISFILNLISAYSANKAHLLEKKFGEKKSIFLILSLTFFSVFLMSFLIPYFSLLLFLIIFSIQGFYDVILGDYLNKHIESSHRATVLSINNMFDNIGITLLFPVIGYVTKIYDMGFSLFYFSMFIMICSFILVYFYKKE